MTQQFGKIAFTDSVRKLQADHGSRVAYSSWDSGLSQNDEMGENEKQFIASRDSFYLATVSESGWPYVQHRGGPIGFIRVLDSSTIGFADFVGNRQYVSAGNASVNDRVCLFFMDYPNRQRLKMFSRVELIDTDQPDLINQLAVPGYRARIERGFLVRVSAFDWNCPQYITPRSTPTEIDAFIDNAAHEID